MRPQSPSPGIVRCDLPVINPSHEQRFDYQPRYRLGSMPFS
ncbi:hypothetical protein CEV34_4227 [Brucella pseudogrignonensis]|uniref:Uncharacterized protein n=1 Tax=Brucella pseudogrignonensis TaxID=419475 RepID=A0A256G5J3_9HYPH|nr:hypothetical protein CEV34_4227 [Brucella pseudogrignonensis]